MSQATTRYDALVFIGRFQPFHRGHFEVLQRALGLSAQVFVLVGSANRARTIKDPFSFDERRQMIESVLSESERCRVRIEPVQDSIYNDGDWLRRVQEAVSAGSVVATAEPGSRGGAAQGNAARPRIGLIGHEKDESSRYLRMFPQWERVEVDATEDISATEIRDQFFAQRSNSFVTWAVPEPVYAWLQAFRASAAFAQLQAEAEFIANYRKTWAVAPYPVTFVTVDAVVVHSGHILLVRRRSEPGRGLWALPGGFLGQDERLEAGCIRELREETGLKLPEPVLRGALKDRQVFDHPDRSLRGRTITHAFLFSFALGDLPRVKGSDDADKARWVPLNAFAQMRDVMFEDHFDIAHHFLGKL